MGDQVERAILITGSGSGIGAATAKRLAAPGAGILVHAKGNASGVDDVARCLEEKGATTAKICADLTNPGAADEIVELAIAKFGRLDVIIHAAGYPLRSGFSTENAQAMEQCFGTIAFSFYHLVSYAREWLEKSVDGRVIAVGSHNAHVFRSGYPNFPISAAAKSALETLIRSLALALSPYGVTANCVTPGLIRKSNGDPVLTQDEWTSLANVVPARRIGEPDEVAAVIAFLVSKDASYVSGQVIHVNGGLV